MPAPLIAAGIGLALDYVPDLIRWITNDNAGDVAEKVADAAKRITGAGTTEEAQAMLAADLDLVLPCASTWAEMEADLEKSYLADRQNARKRDSLYIAAGRENWRANIMLAMAFTFVTAIYSYMALVVPLPDAIIAALSTAGGIGLKMISDAFQFEFGSSRGSKEKSISMEKMFK